MNKQLIAAFISMDPTHYRELLWEKFAECDHMEAMELMGKVYQSGDQETADLMNLKITENKEERNYDTAKPDGYAEHQSSTI